MTDASLHESPKEHTREGECDCCARIQEIENHRKVKVISTTGDDSSPRLGIRGTTYQENDIVSSAILHAYQTRETLPERGDVDIIYGGELSHTQILISLTHHVSNKHLQAHHVKIQLSSQSNCPILIHISRCLRNEWK